MDRTLGENYIEVDGKRQFTDGPPATCVNADFMNQIQEEILTCIVNAGLVPSTVDRTQLSQTIPRLAAGNGQVVYWTDLPSLPYGKLTAAAFDGTQYVIVGEAYGGHATILSSTDLQNWTYQGSTLKNVNLNDVVWNPFLQLFVAVGDADGTNSYILTSSDGVTWTERSPTVNKNVNLISLAIGGYAGNPIMVAVGDADGEDGYILTSTDAVEWTERANAKNVRLWRVCFGGNTFVATGDGDGVDVYILTSTDGGATWTERANTMGSFPGINHPLFHDGNFYIFNSFSVTFWISKDSGTTWDQLGPCGYRNLNSAGGHVLTRVGAGMLHYNAYGSGMAGAVYVSMDGAGWILRSVPTRAYWNMESFGGSFVLAMGGYAGNSFIGYALIK